MKGARGNLNQNSPDTGQYVRNRHCSSKTLDFAPAVSVANKAAFRDPF